MGRCEVCGKYVEMPFKCAYCGSYFCAHHRIPESHNCKRKPFASPNYILSRNFSHYGEVVPRPTTKFRNGKKSNKKALAAILIAVVLIASVALLVSIVKLPFFTTDTSNTILSSSTPNPTPTPYTNPFVTSTPIPQAQLQADSDLANYALFLINTDRQANGLQNVTLSSINSGQNHANEMLKNVYFSHWDMNGYKPYMRYTLAGGKGAVAENCAAILGYYSSLKQALKDMENSMMYDDASSNWGHKDNILNPLHNEVSIGIAFDANNVYLVQDFEDDYISWSQLSVNGNQVTMQGVLQTQTSIKQIDIYYDNPAPLTVNQLNHDPYQHSYDAGTDVAIIVPPLPSDQYYDWSGISVKGIVADTWSQNGNSFQIGFSFSQAVASYGKGVYTLYVITGDSTADSLTTYSIWV